MTIAVIKAAVTAALGQPTDLHVTPGEGGWWQVSTPRGHVWAQPHPLAPHAPAAVRLRETPAHGWLHRLDGLCLADEVVRHLLLALPAPSRPAPSTP